MKLARLQKVSLRDIWKHEAIDFTQWLALEENLTLLSEETGIDLVTAQTEVNVGDFHVDILAEDSNGHKVVIENQLEPTNHDHLGKIITYASGLQATTVVWIVSRARQEHEQAINWLNEHTTEDANFFLIELEVWRIGSSESAPRFSVIAKPNDWAKIARQSGSGSKITDTKLAQQAFWEELRDYGAQQKSKYIKSWQKALPQHWYNISLGSSKAKVSPTINSRLGMVGVELDIHDNKDLFHELLARKDEIEHQIGIKLEWNEKPDKKSSSIIVTKEGDFQNPIERVELIEWIYKTTELFVKVFASYLK